MIKYINFKFYKPDVLIRYNSLENIHTKFKNLGVTNPITRGQLIDTLQSFFRDNPNIVHVWMYVSPINNYKIVVAKTHYRFFDSSFGNSSSLKSMDELLQKSRSAFTNFRARVESGHIDVLTYTQEIYNEVTIREGSESRSVNEDIVNYTVQFRDNTPVPPPAPSMDDYGIVIDRLRSSNEANFYTYSGAVGIRRLRSKNTRKSPDSRSAITKRILKEIKSDMKLDTLDKNIVNTVFKLTAKFKYHSLKPEPRGDFTFPSWMI